MMQFNGCTGIARAAYQSLVHIKKNHPLTTNFVPTRIFIKSKSTSEKSRPIFDQRVEEAELPPLSGIDDPNFTKHFKRAMLNPDFKKSFRNFSEEAKKLRDEIKAKYEKFNFRIDDKEGRIDMLFTFETEEDLKKFSVHTDSSFFQGYSSASLKLSQEGTAIFSGNINTDVPKDGNVAVAGYANISSLRQIKSFYRVKYFDWSEYTHIVFKLRGDGRTYLVLLNIPGSHDETRYMSYTHPLYTRGGPYWQIAKIPFSHFYVTNKGYIMMHQNQTRSLLQIERLGITLAGFDGPFKLEIDYIGLESDESHKPACPYESYR